MPGLTKGLSFRNLESFVLREFGDAAWQDVLCDLTAQDQTQLAAMVPVGWYPLDLYAVVLRFVQQRFAAQRPNLIEAYGRFAAEQDLTTVHKLMLKLANPGLILDQCTKLWSKFHDTGRWTVTRDARHAAGTLTDWGCVDHNLCRELVGYIDALISLGHGKQVRVHHPNCQAHGASACVFEASWR
jgi:hypothetical protein